MFFGFNGIGELLHCLFKNITTNFILKYIVPLIVGIDVIFQFLFQSVGGIYFLIVLYVIDFLSGVAKAIYKKELVSKKFPRFLFTMLAALMILSILKFAGMYVIVFYPLYSIFYGVFTGQQIISIAENLTELKLLPLSLLNKLKRRFGDRFK